MSQTNQPALLPLEYPAGTTLQEKLLIGSARVALAKLLGRVASLDPIGFVSPGSNLIDVQVAVRECLRRDAPTLTLLPETAVDEASGPVLSALAREYLGAPAEGYLSVLTCRWERELSMMSCLPWVLVAFRDSAGWADDLWRAGARDFVFAEPTGARVFAVIYDDHDDEVTVVGAEAAELSRRAAGRE
ncbi:hypothetical protein [Urbifossiella limnaea]|uniref:Uncharacterized protein n=1 Tax=Urbifossiella limnaea TaxID=2528023 RepID=A0A517Y172_9BACT|nr:hypothetical protein [Urbifossiella limnaea]QDU23505.1 hypothetical protein ETAA1_55050 [Urbifossiella limnaea]